MVIVSPNLIQKHLETPSLQMVFNLLENDTETQIFLQMANVMAVNRLKYNDHGPVHSRITSGSALEIFDILSRRFTPTTVKDGICSLEMRNWRTSILRSDLPRFRDDSDCQKGLDRG